MQLTRVKDKLISMAAEVARKRLARGSLNHSDCVNNGCCG
jgi:urease gamma subunit